MLLAINLRKQYEFRLKQLRRKRGLGNASTDWSPQVEDEIAAYEGGSQLSNSQQIQRKHYGKQSFEDDFSDEPPKNKL